MLVIGPRAHTVRPYDAGHPQHFSGNLFLQKLHGLK